MKSDNSVLLVAIGIALGQLSFIAWDLWKERKERRAFRELQEKHK